MRNSDKSPIPPPKSPRMIFEEVDERPSLAVSRPVVPSSVPNLRYYSKAPVEKIAVSSISTYEPGSQFPYDSVNDRASFETLPPFKNLKVAAVLRDSKMPSQCNKKMILLIVVICLLGVATILGVTLSGGSSDTDDESTDVPKDPEIIRIGNDYIGMVFVNDVTNKTKQDFVKAAHRWSQLITNTIPASTFTGLTLGEQCPHISVPVNLETFIGQHYANGLLNHLLIFIEVSKRNDTQFVAFSGICYNDRTLTYPIAGAIWIDPDFLNLLTADGDEQVFIPQKIGLILGLGLNWPNNGLIINPVYNGTSVNVAIKPTYVGASAIAQQQLVIPNVFISGTPIAVEDGRPIFSDEQILSGSARGIADIYWDEEVWGVEVMTAFRTVGQKKAPITRLSLGSLVDLGYTVNFEGADPLSISGRNETNPSLKGSKNWVQILHQRGEGTSVSRAVAVSPTVPV